MQFRGYDASGLAIYSDESDAGHAIPLPPDVTVRECDVAPAADRFQATHIEYDGAPDAGRFGAIGTGATAVAAVADLMQHPAWGCV